ncbi:MAG TPA: ATP-binding protein, partial [Byssovorax sp.]
MPIASQNVARWLRALEAEATVDEASASSARERVRALGASAGLSEIAIASLATAASELAHNHLRHARDGAIAVHLVERAGVAGVEVVAADAGAGIRDPARAMAGGASDKGGLGAGFSSIFRLCDEVDVDVRQSEGTCVWARKFAAPSPRRPQVAVLSRPISGEDTSGDDATFVRRSDGSLLVAIADGLGHGVEARAASRAAMDEILSDPSRSLTAIVDAAHARLAATRGAVMSVAILGAARDVSVVNVGNTTTQIVAAQGSRRFGGQSWFLGQAARRGSASVEQGSLGAREMLVL